MKWPLRIVAGLVATILLGLFDGGRSDLLLFGAGLAFGAPEGDFDPAQSVPAPDYTKPEYWAALPVVLAEYVPAGIQRRDSTTRAPVDVFFIHPTGYMNGSHWNSQMLSLSKTEENTKWMMVNQASVYNGCCEVYAPRYREASIFTYTSTSKEEKDRIMRFAYNDVLKAFEYFLAHYNQGRPFVIASHSQGTHHGIVLLRERIDGTPLAERLVAAYLIGGRLAEFEFDEMKDISICDSPIQLRCAVHWDTMSERAEKEPERLDNVCVNPLSWRRNDDLVPVSEHEGAVPPSGEFQLDFFNDEATGIEFLPLAAPLPNYVNARCNDGVLYVTHQEGKQFDARIPGGTNYHLLDYPLFHMDIRHNAIIRVQTYLQEATEPRI